MKHYSDTITAISTPPGFGAIGIVRLTGPDALSIADKIFRSKNSDSVKSSASHRVLYGFIIDPVNKKIVDEVLLTVMKAPQTFTKEDTVEISCHGGTYNIQRILELAIKSGARLAEPGEFTKRAFLNGRINLLQAEGVIDIINSKSELALDSAVAMLGNELYEKIAEIKTKIFNVAMEVESEIDFSDSEVETSGADNWLSALTWVYKKLNELIDSYDQGRIIHDGLKITIFGRPNVGKSSLMNRILKEERAIVSDAPGTTRDFIEERFSINGIAASLIDTAGIHNSTDTVEQEGIKRTHKKIDESDILLLILDGSLPLQSGDIELMNLLQGENHKIITIINKSDLPSSIDINTVKESISSDICKISAKNGDGVAALLQCISKKIWNGKEEKSDSIKITRRRHFDLLVRTQKAIKKAKDILENNLPMDMLAEELKCGFTILGEITGDTYTEEILNTIFSEFCIGK